MNLWWLQPGWTDARCHCGEKIWPEGDPDWGECYECFSETLRRREPEPEPMYQCDICDKGQAVTGVNGYGVCSEECAHIAEGRAAPNALVDSK